ncbi:MAG: F0F1 ATP synthase subunit A [Bacteriovoracaceae bacterium]|nr:F0F1 ATP synthase subunit A [Bacteriovoracaceae bacterium]
MSILIYTFSIDSVLASNGFSFFSKITEYTNIPAHTITLFLVAIILIVFGFLYRIKIRMVNNVVLPDRGFSFRNIVEMYGQFIYNQCKSILGDKYAVKYFPFIATIFIVILFSNLIGIIPGFVPPTQYLNTTFALSIFVFIYYNYVGCKEVGIFNYLKHFAGPLWYFSILILPVEILSNFVRPISLALRLRGNMFGDHLVLSKFSEFVPALLPIPLIILAILISFIQAYIFMILTMVYINLAITCNDH